MTHVSEATDSRHQYAVAYAAHYSARDLPLALKLYQRLLASHPDSLEADYARMQVQNIVNAVVPKQELQDVEMRVLLTHLAHDGRVVEQQVRVPPTVAG